MALYVLLSSFLIFAGAASVKRGTSELVVLVTDFDGYIYRYDVNGSALSRIPITDRGQGPEALAYDPVHAHIYWTNIRADKIKRANLDGTNEETVLSATETPRGVAIDYISRQLFYTEEKIDIVGTVDLNTRVRKTILNTGMDRPIAITLDMYQKIFYFSDIGSKPKIEMAFYNGTGRKTLVDRNMKWPIALSLDDTRSTLFWCDGSVRKIQSLDLTTMDVTVIKTQSGTHYYDLNYVDGNIYFIDLLKKNAYQTMSADGGAVTSIQLGRSMSKWRKLRVIKVTVCEDMTWGVNCSRNCGNCLGGSVCDKISGHCPTGCKLGYAEPTCGNFCPNGSYGARCNSSCGHCNGGESCHPETGLCLYGCALGWDGRYCKDACAPGLHGEKCESVCGQCGDGEVCDRSTGNCSSGCQPGWSGPQCKQECQAGTFGVDCQYQCQCYDGAVCDKLTGECPKPNVIIRVCPSDRYGDNCSQPCGQCLHNQSCNEVTGQCPGRCSPGWQGSKCKTECSPRRYGVDCIMICTCRGTEVCDSVSGKCYHAHHPHVDKQVSTPSFSETPLTIGLCVVIIVMAVILAVAAVVIFRRKRRERLDSSTDDSSTAEKDFSITFENGKERLITQ